MNSTPILVQPDIVNSAPTVNLDLCASVVQSRWCLAPAFSAADAPQSKRASEREPGPEDFDRIEGEFRIEAALNVAGLAEAMLLAREQEIADRIAFAP